MKEGLRFGYAGAAESVWAGACAVRRGAVAASGMRAAAGRARYAPDSSQGLPDPGAVLRFSVRGLGGGGLRLGGGGGMKEGLRFGYAGAAGSVWAGACAVRRGAVAVSGVRAGVGRVCCAPDSSQGLPDPGAVLRFSVRGLGGGGLRLGGGGGMKEGLRFGYAGAAGSVWAGACAVRRGAVAVSGVRAGVGRVCCAPDSSQGLPDLGVVLRFSVRGLGGGGLRPGGGGGMKGRLRFGYAGFVWAGAWAVRRGVVVVSGVRAGVGRVCCAPECGWGLPDRGAATWAFSFEVEEEAV